MNRRDLIMSGVALALYGPRFPARAQNSPRLSSGSLAAQQQRASIAYPRTAIIATGGYASGDNQSYQASTPWLNQVSGQQLGSSGFFPNTGDQGQLGAIAMMGRNDVVIIGANYEGWGAEYGARSNLVEAIKEICYPANAQSIVLQYEIFETTVPTAYGTIENTTDVPGNESWFLYDAAGSSNGTDDRIAAGSGYETNWAVAWPNDVNTGTRTVAKDNSFVTARITDPLNGGSDAWSGYVADYFANLNFICQNAVSGEASGSIPAAAYLDSRWSFDANEKAPNLDGLYTDNNYANSRYAGYYDLENNYGTGDYTVGAWLVRGAYWHHWQFTQEMAAAYPGRSYYRTCNFSSWDQGYAAGEFSTFSSGMAGYMHGGLLEGLMGQTYGIWSFDGWTTTAGFLKQMMSFLVSPQLAIMGVSTNGATDYQMMRFGLTSALIFGAAVAIDPYWDGADSQRYQIVDYTWYDEFGGNPGTNVGKGWLGQPLTSPTAAAFNGVWIRDFTNGIVICNSGIDGSQTVTLAQINSYLGTDYTLKFFQGAQDATLNSGGTFSSVTLSTASRTLGPDNVTVGDGVLLLKTAGGAAISYRQTFVIDSTSSENATSGAFTPHAGDGLLVAVVDGSGNNRSQSLTSSSGTYAQFSPPGDYNDNETDTWFLWAQYNAAAVSQTITVPNTSKDGVGAIGLDYSGASSASVKIDNPANPGGTGAILGTSVTVPQGSVLVAICANLTGSSSVSSPGGTVRYTGSPFGLQLCVADYQGTGAAIQPSFTCADKTNFVVAQYLLS